MKNRWKKICSLTKYGQRVHLQLILGFIFFILGLIMQINTMIFAGQSDLGEFGTVAYYCLLLCGNVFIMTAAVMPAQVLLSLDCALLAQASPWKKKLQTSVFSTLTGVTTLIALTLSLLFTLAASAKMPSNTIWLTQSFLFCGIVAGLLLVFWPLFYKYYRLSTIILFFITVMINIGIWCYPDESQNAELIFQNLRLPTSPVACILLSYIAVLAAFGVNYLLTLALYKKPLSKHAFGILMQKWL